MKNTYKDVDNLVGSCKAHVGVWDHGSTGTKMRQYVSEFQIRDKKSLSKQTVMWEPHWTCCRRDWDAEGKS